MERTQIQLTSEQARRVREAAAARRVSMAAYIREAVEARLSSERTSSDRQRAIESIGGFASGDGDVSRRHDDHLAGAYRA